MTEKVKSRKLNMPMLEIIITLGILTIVSVFLMRLFLGANSLETKAKDISKACILAQSVGETIKIEASIEDAIKELGLVLVKEDGISKVYEKYYDSSWKASVEKKAYTMTVIMTETPVENTNLLTADIKITKDKSYPVIKKDEEPLASITCKSYKRSSISASLGQ